MIPKLFKERHQIKVSNGLVKRLLKELGYSLSDLSKAIQLKPNFAEAYDQRGILFNILENNFPAKRGCADICKAYSLGYPRQQDLFSNDCNCKK